MWLALEEQNDLYIYVMEDVKQGAAKLESEYYQILYSVRYSDR